MTYPETADRECELTPVVTREILAIYEKQGPPLEHAAAAVAAKWHRLALDEGFPGEVADDAARFVRRVGDELKKSGVSRPKDG